MKTKVFIKRVKALGYDAYKMQNTHILIYVKGFKTPIYVGIKQKNKINSDNLIVSDELFDLCVEYARTPIKEREDERRYYLYHPVKGAYFNYHKRDEYYVWNNTTLMLDFQTMFTEEEIKNHKFQDIMELLEKEEVE